MLQVLIDLYGNWRNRCIAAAAKRNTINELSRLSNHDLKDIGLCRGDIRPLAEDHYNRIVLELSAKSPTLDRTMNYNLRGWI